MTPQDLTIQLNLMASLDHAPALTDQALFGWVQSCLATGDSPSSIIARLITAKHPVAVATILVTLAQKNLVISDRATLGSTAVSSSFDPVQGSSPPSPTLAPANTVQLDARSIPCLWSMARPDFQAHLYGNFLSQGEIDHLKTIATPRLTTSGVLDKNFGTKPSLQRTSQQTFLPKGSDPVVTAIDSRISSLVGLPLTTSEDLQILHYLSAGEYQPHFDYFSPQTPEEKAIMAHQGGNRIGTFLMYLSEVEAGGSTFFPHLGVTIHPQPGQALWFSYPANKTSHRPSISSQHAGMPVIKGDKWLATKWFRERTFSPLVGP